MQEAMTHSNPAVFAVLASDDEALRDKCIGAMKRLKKLCKAEAETSFHLVPLLDHAHTHNCCRAETTLKSPLAKPSPPRARTHEHKQVSRL